MQRRKFIATSGLLPFINIKTHAQDTKIQTRLKPNRLKTGDTIGIICPAAPMFDKEALEILQESLTQLGFNYVLGTHINNRYGYLAGSDQDRASDMNMFFKNKNIQGIICLHGGWGCARLLPLLDYEAIKNNPKVLMGYSDITALLLGIYARTGLVCFHGPVGSSTWNAFTLQYFKSVIINAEETYFENPKKINDNLTIIDDRIVTLNSGIASGILMGGNLTVLSHLVGSPYFPDSKGSILFCEDIDEAPYRIDRMLTHLRLAGIFSNINGFIFGKCTDCTPNSNGGMGSLSLRDVLDEVKNYFMKPAFSGSMIGHIKNKFTIPIGIMAEMDATKGTLKLLEPAVL
ncbi:MAG: LD-carboxypeptidase [Alphaproteobacteria bacterium]|nr:LD-carboxypeptidase [Alphaproteobacteria bacterium]